MATGIKDNVNTVIAQRGAVAVFVVLTLLLIVVVIAYLVWRMNRKMLQSTMVLKDPRKLLGSPSPLVFSTGKLPAMGVGQPYSMSFWLYLTDYPTTTNQKLLLWRQSTAASTVTPLLPGGAGPIVMMDKNMNKLYVSVPTTRAPPSAITSLDQVLSTTGTGASNQWTYLTATVEYVPLQRWVNFVFTVQDSMLTVYQDGSIYTVQSLYDMVDQTNNSQPRPIFSGVVGDMTVGSPSKSLASDISGFAARVQFFNYALTSRQVRELYTNGPTAANLLRTLGLPAYGLRSPVYSLDTAGDSTAGNGHDNGQDSWSSSGPTASGNWNGGYSS